MVQAAGAIGLQMNQLAEETRSMLTGAIDPRTSRIATVLGLRNEDIDRYKGNAEGLFNFLMEKLAAYRVAGIESQKTWAGLWSNTKDIVLQSLGKAFEPLFDALKYELGELTKSIVTIDDKAKKIKWNPEFLEGVKTIRAGIVAVLAELYRMGMLLDRIGGTFATLKLDPKMNDMFRQRYMASEKALQDMAMRETGGWKPVTPEIDKQMREAALKGKKIFEQTFVNVGNPEEATQQLLRYYREIGGGQKAGWQGNPAPPDEKELEKARKEKERLDNLWIASEGRKMEEADEINRKYFEDRAKEQERLYLSEMELFDRREKENAEYLAGMTARLKAEREGEIQAQLAELDIEEAIGRAHSDTLQERIRLMEELRESQEMSLAGIDKEKDPAGWNAQMQAIQGTRKALAELSREIAMQNPFGAISLGLKAVANDAADVGKKLYDSITRAFDGMTEALTDFVMTGKASFSDLANSIIRDLIRIMIQQQITGPLASAAGNWLGSLGTPAPGEFGPDVGPWAANFPGRHHTGGTVGGRFRLVPNIDIFPRRHGGGLAPDERLVVNKVGERYITEEQNAWLTQLAEGMGRGGSPQSVKVEVNNKGGQELAASAPEVRFDADEMVIRIVLNAAQNNKYGFREALFGR